MLKYHQYFLLTLRESGNKSVIRHSLCECNGLDRVTEVRWWYYTELLHDRYLKLHLKWLKIKKTKIMKENELRRYMTDVMAL